MPMRSDYPFGMAQPHDRKSLSLAGSSMMQLEDRSAGAASAAQPPASCQMQGTDPLSDVLRTVKLTGALFFLTDASFPWGVEVPHPDAFSSIILPRAQHVVSYHIILKGARCRVLISGHSIREGSFQRSSDLRSVVVALASLGCSR
jgi:hypothetical protein